MSKKPISVRLVTRFRGNRAMSSLLDLTGQSLKERKWVFILGCYNSGTTLLDEILSSHEQFSGLSEEGVMLTDKLPRPEDFLWRRLWWKCESEMLIPYDSAVENAKVIKRHWSHFYNQRKEFLIEKSISNTPRAMFFEENFQPAYFIHIVRNGYAVAEGIRRKADVMRDNPAKLSKEYPIEWCASQWKRSIEVVRDYKDRMNHFMEISYEELTEDPDKTFGKICAFVGARPFQNTLKDSAFEVHRKTEPILNMNERSIRNLNQEQIAAINGVAGDLLKQYGYFTNRS